jgi:hypothetical protein
MFCIGRHKTNFRFPLGDLGQLKLARAGGQIAKVALGERGTVWGDDGSPDFNRHKRSQHSLSAVVLPQ